MTFDTKIYGIKAQVAKLKGTTPIKIHIISEEMKLWIRANTQGSVKEFAGHLWFEDEVDAGLFLLYWIK